MKKLFYIALMLVCGFTTSCDVLDTEPKDSYNELLIWRNKDLAENVLKEAIRLSAEQYDAMSRDAYQYGSKKYATSGAVERFVELLDGRI